MKRGRLDHLRRPACGSAWLLALVLTTSAACEEPPASGAVPDGSSDLVDTAGDGANAAGDTMSAMDTPADTTDDVVPSEIVTNDALANDTGDAADGDVAVAPPVPACWAKTCDAAACQYHPKLYRHVVPKAVADEVVAGLPTEGNDVVLAGSAKPNPNKPRKVALARVGVDGQTVWSHAYEAASGLGRRATALIRMQDGGYAITAGRAVGNYSEAGAHVLRTDAAGKLLWLKTIISKNEFVAGLDDEFNSLAEIGTGEFIVAGVRSAPNGMHGAWLVRADDAGAVVWEQMYFWTVGAFNAVVPVVGGFAAGGHVMGYGGYTPALVAVKSNGGQWWGTVYGKATQWVEPHGAIRRLVAVPQGGFAWSGVDEFGKDVVVRTDSQGITKWSLATGGTDTVGPVLLSDGGVAYATSMGKSSPTCVVVGVNGEGSKLWTRDLGTESPVCTALSAAEQDGLILAGTTKPGPESPQAWVARLDADGHTSCWQVGACAGKSAGQCEDGDLCTLDLCDPTSGCVHLPDGISCDDGNPCTKDGCLASTGCVAEPLAAGASCGAGMACKQQGSAVACCVDCSVSQCGDDGCGGACGSCPAGQVCTSGQCAPAQASSDCGDMAGLQQGAAWPMPGYCPTRISRTPAPAPKQPTIAWNISASAAPAVDTGGVLYLPRGTALAAVSADGTVQWEFPVTKYGVSSPALAADGTVVFGTAAKQLHALSPDGKEKWAFTATAAVGSPAIAADGTILAGAGKDLIALDAKGTLKWQLALAGTVAPVALGPDGTIYACAGKYLHAVKPDGTEKWKAALTYEDKCMWPVVLPDGTVAVQDAYLNAFQSDGKKLWTHKNYTLTGAPAVSVDGKIVSASYQGDLLGIASDGTTSPLLEAGFALSGPPILAAAGSVVVGGLQLMAHQPADAKSSWTLDKEAFGPSNLGYPIVVKVVAMGLDGRVYLLREGQLFAVGP